MNCFCEVSEWGSTGGSAWSFKSKQSFCNFFFMKGSLSNLKLLPLGHVFISWTGLFSSCSKCGFIMSSQQTDHSVYKSPEKRGETLKHTDQPLLYTSVVSTTSVQYSWVFIATLFSELMQFILTLTRLESVSFLKGRQSDSVCDSRTVEATGL